MNRYNSNQQRFNDAIRKAFQRGASGRSESDVTRYKVIIEDSPFLIGEKNNEVVNGKTISTYTSALDSSGLTFTHIRDFVHCTACSCNINIRNKSRIYICSICGKTVCESHCIKLRSQKLTFCNSAKCVSIGRLCQLTYYTFKIAKFSASMIFGFDSKESDSDSSLENPDDEINFEDEKENEFKEIIKRFERER